VDKKLVSLNKVRGNIYDFWRQHAQRTNILSASKHLELSIFFIGRKIVIFLTIICRNFLLEKKGLKP